MSQRFDFIEGGVAARAAALKTAEGWIRDDPVISRVGIFEYRTPAGGVRREYRPAAEVFHADSLATLRGIPVTVGHPGIVTATAHTAAIIGTVLSAGRQDGSNLRAELVIHNPAAMGANRDISLGYNVELDETPGEWNGQRYDAVQRRVRYNHCAIVPKGRMGNSRLTLDAADAVMISSPLADSSGAELARARMIQAGIYLDFEQSLHRARSDAAPAIQSAEDARNRMIERTRNAWKGGR